MHEADLGRGASDCLDAEGDECAEVAPDGGQGDAERREVSGVEGSFESAACDEDDAAEGGGGLD